MNKNQQQELENVIQPLNLYLTRADCMCNVRRRWMHKTWRVQKKGEPTWNDTVWLMVKGGTFLQSSIMTYQKVIMSVCHALFIVKQLKNQMARKRISRYSMETLYNPDFMFTLTDTRAELMILTGFDAVWKFSPTAFT